MKQHVIYIVFLFIVNFYFYLVILTLSCVLSCYVSLVLSPVGTLFHCLLLVFVLYCSIWFSNCFRMSSKGSIFLCLSNWCQRYCSAVIWAVFICLPFLVISHPVFVTFIVYDLLMWLWSFPTIVPWVHGPPFSCWTATVDPIRIIS